MYIFNKKSATHSKRDGISHAVVYVLGGDFYSRSLTLTR